MSLIAWRAVASIFERKQRSSTQATSVLLIGAGGLGDEIVRGLQTNDPTVLFAGAITVALLALCTELILSGAGRLLEAVVLARRA